VVLNNDGGRIFEQLPLADRIGTQEPVFEYWLTSHGLNLARAGPLYDLPAVSVDSSEELAAALEQAHSRACCTLIEARVGSQDARHDLQALWREVDRCLSRLCGDAAAREPA
jgi:2-succinyl-5-enolpyruvyl-6-hydroxy-3-cyclohexene-1-carboxylate synthase